MPRSWTAKDERMYRNIKNQQLRNGRPTDRAEEIAARTVNKQRRREGRTANQRSQGTGNPNAPLEERTRDELYNRAKSLGIHGRSRMHKSELIRAIRNAS